ncbi:MAG: gliding motility-associated C-terminal domain-containing protein, partial [Saprospiraceae bacterium]
FSVTYLNSIEAIDQSNGMDCFGSFRARGGLPELDGSDYTISIELVSNPNVTGSIITGSTTHDDVVQYTVNQPGDYRVTIEDGKSCEFTFVQTLATCDAVSFSFPFLNALPGTTVCIPITVEDFVSVSSFSYTAEYDPSVLSFTNIQNVNPNLAPGGLIVAIPDGGVTPFGKIPTTYSSSDGSGATIPNGETLYEICFLVTGTLGEFSPLQFTEDITSFTVTVEPPGGGTDDSGFAFNDGQVNISDQPFFVSLVGDTVSCPGAADGSISITLSQGQPDYTVTYRRISPNFGSLLGPFTYTDATISDVYTDPDLIAGFYRVNITDGAGNMVVDTVQVSSGPAVGLSIIDRLPSCFGETDGSIRIAVNLDGVPVIDPVGQGYLFNWSVPTPVNIDSITGLAGGVSYSVTVTSPLGCSVNATIPLGNPARLNVLPMNPVDGVTDATCSGSGDGSIQVLAGGGTPFAGGQYDFTFADGSTIRGTQANLDNLDPGDYLVTITDARGCTAQATFPVSADKLLIINAVVTDITCNGLNNGEVFATATAIFNTPVGSPTEPYTFQWSANAPAPTSTGNTTEITGLMPGLYFLTATDVEGCEVVDSFQINEPPALVVDAPILTNETCITGNDGTATLVVSGGTPPYTYDWSHDAMLTDSIATGLSAMMGYMVTVTDANGCEDITTFDILAPIPPQITSLADDFVSCPDATDGQLSVTVVPGGSPIASIQWSTGGLGGPTNTTISNLNPGTYFVTITDQGQCTTIDSAQVLSPGSVVLDSTNLVLPTCPGDGNGRIALFVSGGTAPYTFTWSTDPNNPGTLNPLTNLTAGTYTVTITDANNCTPTVETIVLPDPAGIVGTFTDLQAVSCPNDNLCDGQATIGAVFSDGTAGTFNFTFSSGESVLGATMANATQLCRGAFDVTITDGVCGVIVTDTIASPEDIVIQPAVDPVTCNGDADGSVSLTVTGGTPGYNFSWVDIMETTPMVDDLPAGTYTVIVTDANGCSRTQGIELTEPDPLVLELDIVQSTPSVSCAGDTDGVLAVFVNTSGTNPLPAMPYVFSGGVGDGATGIAAGLSPGTYGVTVTDVKGCMDDLTYTIDEPTPIVFTVLPIEEPLCFGESTLVNIDTAFGGRADNFADFTFSVNNDGFRIPVTSPGRTFAGTTIVTVFDTVGCSATADFSVNQPPQITIDLVDEITIELGDSLTQLNPIVNPVGDIYDYLWTPADFLSSDSVRAPFIFPFDNRQYTLQVTNANGCTAFDEIFVRVDANRNVYIPNAFSPNRDGRNEDFRVFVCRGVVGVARVQIYDRWGGQVFYADQLPPNCLDGIQLWDGMRNGKPVNTGVYVYSIEVVFLDGQVLTYRGDVTVVR